MRVNVRSFSGFSIPESPLAIESTIHRLRATAKARAAMQAKAKRLVRQALIGFVAGASIVLLADKLATPSFRFSINGQTQQHGLSMSQCLDRWIPFEGTATGVGCHAESFGEHLGALLAAPVMPRRASRFATRNV